MAVQHVFTRAQLREKLVRRLRGYYPAFTVDSSQAGTITSSDLTHVGEGGAQAALTGWWLMLTSGSHLGEVAAIRDHTVQEGNATITYSASAFGGEELPNGVKGFVLNRNPIVLHDVLNEACLELYPDLHVAMLDESNVISGLLLNPSVEVLDPAENNRFLHWDSPMSLVDVSDDIVIHGMRSAVLEPRGSTLSDSPDNDNMTQDVQLREAGARTNADFHFGCFVYAPAVRTVVIRLYDEDDNVVGEDSNDYAGEWTRLYCRGTDARKVGIRYTGESGTMARADAFFLDGGDLYRYRVPDNFIEWPSVVSIQQDQYHPNGPFTPITGWRRVTDGDDRYIVLDEYRNVAIYAGHYLRLEGRAPVGRDLVADDADDTARVEVNGPRAEALVEYATGLAKERFSEGVNFEAAEELRREARRHMDSAMMKLDRGDVRQPLSFNPAVSSKLV